MTRVIWTPQAAEDLEETFEYIARDSPHYARLLIQQILASVDVLETFPRSGRQVPEIGREGVRELIHGAYRIVYRVETSDAVKVLTVFRASRQFPKLE